MNTRTAAQQRNPSGGAKLPLRQSHFTQQLSVMILLGACPITNNRFVRMQTHKRDLSCEANWWESFGRHCANFFEAFAGLCRQKSPKMFFIFFETIYVARSLKTMRQKQNERLPLRIGGA